MSANFSPELHKYSGIKPLKAWIQMTLPQVYDDALSYQELVYKVLYHLNVMIDDLETMGENIDTLKETYEKLEDYVNDYFDNLDVQAQIDDKIDRMTEEGVFDELFQSYVEALQVQIDNILSTDINIDGMVMPLDGSSDICHLGTCSTAAETAAKVVTVNGEFALKQGAIIFVKFTYTSSISGMTLNVDGTGAVSIVVDDTNDVEGHMWRAGAVVCFVYDGSNWVMISPPFADTSYRGVVKLSSATDSNSTDVGANSAAVKAAYDLAQSAYNLATQNEAGEVTTVPQLSTARGINGALFDGSADITNYCTCVTASGTRAKVATCDSEFKLYTGAKVTVTFTYGCSITNTTLNVNGSGAATMYENGAYLPVNAWRAGETVEFVYDGTYWQKIGKYTGDTQYTGPVKLSTTLNSSTEVAATPYLVMQAYELAQSAMETADEAIGAISSWPTSTQSYEFIQKVSSSSGVNSIAFDLSSIDLSQYSELIFKLDVAGYASGRSVTYLAFDSSGVTEAEFYTTNDPGSKTLSLNENTSSYGLPLGYRSSGGNYTMNGGELRIHLNHATKGFWFEYNGVYMYSETYLERDYYFGFPSMNSSFLSGTELSYVRFTGTRSSANFAANSAVYLYGIKNS